MFVRHHMRIYRNDQKFVLSQSATRFWIPAARELGAGDQQTLLGKIKRTGVRELADRQRSRNLCLHIGFWKGTDWR